MVRPNRLTVTALALLAMRCAHSPPPSAIDIQLSARVPPTADLLAGLDLARLRASPLFAQLPPAARALLEPFRDARYALVVSRAGELLVIARGAFSQPPPGATMATPDLALTGAPALVREAAAAHASTGSPLLLDAEPLAASGASVWIVARGGVALPLTGNPANLNRLLRDPEIVTLAAHLGDSIDLDLAARCPTPEAARSFEQSLRAAASLATLANARQPDVAALLGALRITRDGRQAHAAVSANAAALAKLF
jgi:hypothetical protein